MLYFAAMLAFVYVSNLSASMAIHRGKDLLGLLENPEEGAAI